MRAGKLTASNAKTISVGGAGLKTLVFDTLAEKYALNNDEESYMSEDMQRGVEREEQARMTYEIQYQEIEQVGFIEVDEYVGASPDGFIGEDGGIEIKCPNNSNFFKLMVEGEDAIDKKYLWQCQMCMLVSGRKWWDLVFWNGNFENNLIVFKIVPDLSMQEKLIVGLEKGKQLIIKLEEEYGKRTSSI